MPAGTFSAGAYSFLDTLAWTARPSLPWIAFALFARVPPGWAVPAGGAEGRALADVFRQWAVPLRVGVCSQGAGGGRIGFRQMPPLGAARRNLVVEKL